MCDLRGISRLRQSFNVLLNTDLNILVENFIRKLTTFCSHHKYINNHVHSLLHILIIIYSLKETIVWTFESNLFKKILFSFLKKTLFFSNITWYPKIDLLKFGEWAHVFTFGKLFSEPSFYLHVATHY